MQIPEPLDLIAKTVHLVDETVKTGAPIGFLNLERFNAGRRLELEKLAQINGSASGVCAPNGLPTDEKIAELRNNATQLPKYMVSMFDIGKVVYCRYGREYIPNVARQIYMALQNPVLSQPIR
jgi:hypothetical protein